MRPYIQASLLVAAALYISWAIGLLFAPQQAHEVLSRGFYDGATLAVLGAALFGLVGVFLIAAQDMGRRLIQASIISLLLFAVVWAYQLFISEAIPLGAFTVITLIVTLVVAAFLLMTLSDNLMELQMLKALPGRVKIRAGSKAATQSKKKKKTSSKAKRRKR